MLVIYFLFAEDRCKIRKGTKRRNEMYPVTKYRAVVGRKLYDFVSYCCTAEQSPNWIFSTSDKLTNRNDIHHHLALL